jgi:hypothetical protein
VNIMTFDYYDRKTTDTTLTGFDPARRSFDATISVLRSTDGGVTWSVVGTPAAGITTPPLTYTNTTFRDGIEDTFTVGRTPVNGRYPLYVAYEDYSAGVGNLALTASYDNGVSWTAPIRVNDNVAAVDEIQPNLAGRAAPGQRQRHRYLHRRLLRQRLRRRYRLRDLREHLRLRQQRRSPPAADRFRCADTGPVNVCGGPPARAPTSSQ